MAKIYEKIPGLGAGGGGLQIAGRTRLFTGPDHLLIVKSSGYTEEYKRIFFRDIRYVEVRKTKNMVYHAIASGLLTLLFALLFFVELSVITVVILCAPFLIWFGVNLFRGSSCVCYINTNVQTLELSTPRRMKKVPLLIDFLRAKTSSVATPPPVG